MRVGGIYLLAYRHYLLLSEDDLKLSFLRLEPYYSNPSGSVVVFDRAIINIDKTSIFE